MVNESDLNDTAPPSLDARISHVGRVAGVDRVLISNGWFDCPIEVRPSGPGKPVGYGFTWKATFRPTDRPDDDRETRIFEGASGTRQLAAREAIDVVTKHISAVAEARRLSQFGTRALQPEAVGQGAAAVVERVKRTFTKLAVRLRLR